MVARRKDSIEKIESEIERKYQVKTLVIPKDLSKLQSSKEIFESTLADGVHVDILINNVGFAVYGKLHQTEFERNQELLMINIVALSSRTHFFLKPMVENKFGIIINIASTAGAQPVPYMSNYGASKGFVNQFTEGIPSRWN